MIAAAEATHARLIVMDNLYMYGDPGGQALTEDMPYNAHTKKGTLRAKMSEELLAAHTAGRIQVAVGRASDFFGPGVNSAALSGDLVFKRALAGKAAQAVGAIDTPHSYTYVPDVGRALVTLAEHDDALGQVWHLPTAPAISTRQIITQIYAELGQPVKIQVAPRWLLRLMGLFNPYVREMFEMLYEFEAPFVVDDSKFVTRFGWGATPLEAAIKDTVAWFKAQA